MAIVNVTPDSFSDGGSNLDPAMAAAYAERAIAEGASILDVGGESTRPGAPKVPAQEQIRRIVPAVRAIRDKGITAPISIDTTIASVAEAALDSGASIVNDISGGTDDPAMVRAIAHTGAGCILMHRRLAAGGPPGTHTYERDPDYADEGGVVASVRTFLDRAARRAQDAGIRREQIVIDPGLGFGKSVDQNYELIARAGELLALGYPVLSAASRKSFLGAATGQTNPADRVEASVAVTVAQYLSGVRLFRVHDVSAHARALAVAMRIAHADAESPGE